MLLLVPPFFPATMLLLKAGKKGGRRIRHYMLVPQVKEVSRPPFFPAFNNSIVAGKKGGHVESTVDDECSPVRAAKLIACSLHSPPFFPATMLLLKAGKKGGGRKAMSRHVGAKAILG